MKKAIRRLHRLRRPTKIAVQMLCDLVLLVASFLIAIPLSGGALTVVGSSQVWAALALSVVATLAGFWAAGLYRVLVRYITGMILLPVGKGAIVAAASLFAADMVLRVPLAAGLPIIHGMLAFLSVGWLRFIVRHLFRQGAVDARTPVIIFGAGEAGLQLLNTLFHGQDFAPVAFVDDDPALHQLSIGGQQVYAPDELGRLGVQTGARLVLLAAPSMSRERRRALVEQLNSLDFDIKTIPTLSEIISGKAKISELRSVAPEDLLGRDPVIPNPNLLTRNIAGKTVMVSGAGGSIGSELCRQILAARPATLILFEISEFALYAIEAEISETACQTQSPTRIVPILGSVQDAQRLATVISGFGVQTIYHAAAYKHVPIVEENIIEGIRNNVFGTLTIATLARDHGVENFILISTDKAVRPTNIMGATKRIAELICQALAQEGSATIFSMVRFGNVLGSSGSVIPRFRRQIAAGGPVTVTHRDITRYFMTIAEASQLVIQAGAMARGGDVFVLDMGQPVRIFDLALEMIRRQGLRPYTVDTPGEVYPERGDIPVCVTGLRKGEKLYEELLIGNNPAATAHPRIMTASETALPLDVLAAELEQLAAACAAHDIPAIINSIARLPVQYTQSHSGHSDIVWSEVAKAETVPLRAVGGA